MMPIAIAAGVAVLLVIALVIVGRTDKSVERAEILEKLGVCQQLLTGSPSEKKDAIIQMDTLLGKSLGFAGVRGDSVGARLKNADRLFDKNVYNGIWDAHKLRNKMVHEQYMPTEKELQRAAHHFKLSIKRLL